VAREVAVAITMALSEDTPSAWKRKNSTGTMTIPPPTPSRPAKSPAKTPVPINDKITVRLSIKNCMYVISLVVI
jgi:hypothetical protein